MRWTLALWGTLLAAGCLEAGPAATTGTDPQPAGDEASSAGGGLAPAWGGEDAPIRPGASLGGYCTFNFLYHDNATGAAYIGTAGHCTEELGERLELPGVGEVATVVYDSDVTDGADAEVDFTLARLDDDKVGQANPRMLGHDGPRGIFSPGESVLGERVGVHGYGLVLGQNAATRDRSGVLVTMDERLYSADMPAVNGDSGSPLLHLSTGTAVGIISHYGFGATPPSTDEGPTMPFILDELAKAGFHVQLSTVD